MIPAFTPTGLLPPGIHPATWNEIVERYGTNRYRLHLLHGLLAALRSLRVAGCRTVYLDGSFVTTETVPNDFDACWAAVGIDPGLLDPVLLDFSDWRAAQRRRFGGELFPAEALADVGGTSYLDYFQQFRRTGAAKGIVALDLGRLP